MDEPPRSALLTTTVEEAGGARVRVARLGSGSPLVLLHGYPDNLQVFARVAPLLAAAHEVIAFDWPGMGESGETPGPPSPGGMADRLASLLDAFGIPRASLLGMDMGAPPALVLAAREPERVGRLVVLNSLLFPDERTSPEIRVMRRLGLNALALRFLPRLVFRRVVETSLPAGERLPPELEADLWSSFRKRSVRSFVARLCAAYESDLAALPALYAGVTAPTLALWGSRDHHFPPAHGERLRAAIPGAEFRRIEGGEHWMVLSAPGAVAAEVLRFTSP